MIPQTDYVAGTVPPLATTARTPRSAARPPASRPARAIRARPLGHHLHLVTAAAPACGLGSRKLLRRERGDLAMVHSTDRWPVPSRGEPAQAMAGAGLLRRW